MKRHSKLTPTGTIVVTENLELYRLVDFLNRNLKDEGLLFGLSKSDQEEGKMVFSYYRV